jgi:hypothetical protein
MTDFREHRDKILKSLSGFLPSREIEQIRLLRADRGFKPVSDRMEPEYRKAAATVLPFLSGIKELDARELVAIGQCKGIFSRVNKRDQHDWATVQCALRIRREDAAAIAQILGELGRCIRDGQPPGRIRKELEAKKCADALQRLIQHLDTAHRGLPTLKRKKSIGHRIQDRPHRVTLRPNSKAALERANEDHRKALDLLSRILRNEGFVVEENPFIDLYTRLKTGPAVFEIKSINTRNERTQCREAVAQLLEYRYRHKVEDASLWLVFSQRPTDEDLSVAFPNSIGIRVIWVDGNGFKGSDASALLKNVRVPLGQ